jgi:Uri superfamily endonuclease
MPSPPNIAGTYALILQTSDDLEVPIGKDGRFGTMLVEPGYYVYVGSAHGPGGLRSRLNRHVRDDRSKPPHWHIDFLRAVTQIIEIWWSVGTDHDECDWSKGFRRMRRATVPLDKFGASDCTAGCPAHLYRPPRRLRVRTLRKHLAAELRVPVAEVQIGVQRIGGSAGSTIEAGFQLPNRSRGQAHGDRSQRLTANGKGRGCNRE